MIRPFRSEVARYGEYSKSGESVYDHPFLFGSKRTGPDLAREGVNDGVVNSYRKPNSWHFNHLVNPQKMNAASIMPPYPYLAENTLDISILESKISTLRSVGVPYPVGFENNALADLNTQAKTIGDDLRSSGINVDDSAEIIALIAYLQRLGTDLYKDK
jgi:cytochrome c oxidase cbb3-type subunit I/II